MSKVRIERAVRYLREHPRDPDALRDVRLLLMEAGQRQRLARVLCDWAPTAPNDELAARALCEAAELFAETGVPKAQLSCLVEAMWYCPTDETAASTLRELLEAGGDYVYLAELMTEWALALRREGAPSHQCAHASWVTAHLRATFLDDLPGAIEALRDAVEVCPSHYDALSALAVLYERRAERAIRPDGSIPSVARLDRHRAAELRIRAAELCSPVHARAQLRTALEDVPEHTRALDMLLELERHHPSRACPQLAAYVEHAPARVATLKRRLKLARLLVAKDRAAEAAPHLLELMRHGSVEARRLWQRAQARDELRVDESGVRTGSRRRRGHSEPPLRGHG